MCDAAIKNPYHHCAWDIGFLAQNPVIRSKAFGVSEKAKSVRYPIRMLRYWFGFHLLREKNITRSRPLDVVEIGIDRGQMLAFAKSAVDMGQKLEWKSWTGVDPILQSQKLAQSGYDDVLEGDLEKEFRLDRSYDAAVLLHVLEHLFDPEAAMKKVAACLRPGGVVIGGFPVVPEFCRKLRQAHVRKRARPMGHVSVFSPKRVAAMGAQAGLETEFLAGAFFMRSKGSRLENSPAWMRFNLRFGARFPSWPGEVYWLMRKTDTSAANSG